MRRALLLIMLLTPATSAHAGERPLVISNVTLIDGTGAPARPGQTILVRGGKVAAVGKAGEVRVPEGAEVIDGRGKFVIPGLWDMHVHLYDERSLDFYLAHGVTGVRHMYTFMPFFGIDRGLRESKPGRPRVVAANSALDGPSTGFPRVMRERLHFAEDDKTARAAVRAIKEAGEPFVKVFGLLPRVAYLAAADEAKKLGLPLVGHVPHTVTAAEASDAGQQSIEHLTGVPLACAKNGMELAKELTRAIEAKALTGLDAASAWRFQLKAHDAFDPDAGKVLFAKFAKNQTWQVPTLVESRTKSCLADDNLLTDPRLLIMPTSLRLLWKVHKDGGTIHLPGLGLRIGVADLEHRKRLFDAELKMVGLMHKAKVPILAGTDAPNPYCFPGSGLHDELELLVKAGLSPMEALQAATRNAAVFLGREQEFGTVEVGKAADLVILDADPLEKIANVRKVGGVVAGGKYLPREELKKLLER